MPSVITNAAKEIMMIAVSGDDLKVALLDNIAISAATILKEDYGSWVDLSAHEVTGTGYTAGGIDLSGVSAYSTSADDSAYFNGDAIVWNSSTISSYGYALYRSTSNLVIAIVQFGGTTPKVSTSGPFSISWTDDQILQMVG